MSSRRLVKLFEGSTHSTKVHVDTEWDEYRVTLVAADGTIQSTYYTDYRDDAISTAQSILKQVEANATPKPAPADDWKSVEVTVTAEDLLNLLAACARYDDTAEGRDDIDQPSMKVAHDNCLSVWMDAVRANNKRRQEYLDILKGI